MKSKIFQFALAVSIVFTSGMSQPAWAITNATYQQNQAKVTQALQQLQNDQKEILLAVKKLEAQLSQLNSVLKELKSNNLENRANSKKIEQALQKNASIQGQALQQLATIIDKNQEKNLKVMELIYQLLSKQGGK